MKVVLFCGGLGMRIREYPEPIPKPMITIGYRPILWSASTGDGSTRTTPDQMVRYAVAEARPGAILITHFSQRAVTALPGIIDGLRVSRPAQVSRQLRDSSLHDPGITQTIEVLADIADLETDLLQIDAGPHSPACARSSRRCARHSARCFPRSRGWLSRGAPTRACTRSATSSRLTSRVGRRLSEPRRR